MFRISLMLRHSQDISRSRIDPQYHSCSHITHAHSARHLQIVDAELQGKTFLHSHVAGWQDAIIENILTSADKHQTNIKYIGHFVTQCTLKIK